MFDKNKSSERIKSALSTSAIGIDMTDEEIQQLASLAVEAEFKKGVRILEEGSKSRDIYIILSGQVSVMMDLKAMQKLEERVARMSDGEIFGEFAFVSAEARSASIRAETKVTLLQLKYDSLMDLFAENPKIGYKMMWNISVILTKKVAEQKARLRKLLFYN